MIYIQAIHMEPAGSSYYEHIAQVKWVNPATQHSDYSTTAQMVDWIRAGGDARVSDARGEVQVGVVDADPPYIRTHADKRYTDNLLSLPRY